ncbi:MAG TPA: hypothetical protein VH300_10955 [Thermoleophilaceae bacterium]|nr:hypothetical protein [Thermoleophilaceae bacterium]
MRSVAVAPLLTVLACLCLGATAGAAAAGSDPTPDPAPTGGTSPDPAPNGGATAPVVKRVAATPRVAPRHVTTVVAAVTMHATPVPIARPTAAAAAPPSVGHRRARRRHVHRAHPDRPRTVDLPRPETAVRFLGDLPRVYLRAGRSAHAGSSDPLLPVAVALFLVVVGEGSLLRITARLPGRPDWR